MRLLPLLLLAAASGASALTVPAAACTTRPVQSATWPNVTPPAAWDTMTQDVLKKYAAGPFDWWNNVSPEGHTWNGNYLNSRVGKVIKENANVHFEGILPYVYYPDGLHLNPITLAQYALKIHSQYLKTQVEADKTLFLQIADQLISMQDARGAFLHPFKFQSSRNFTAYPSDPGWSSALAQGQTLSVMARAWDLTKEAKYLDSGNQAFNYLNTPVAQGGVRSDLSDVDPSLKPYIFFEEYPTDGKAQASHVLNGFMFTLLGVHDWSYVSSARDRSTAARYYTCGITTLHAALPHYDVGHDVLDYDLGHLSTPERMRAGGTPQLNYSYQGVHIYLFLALDSIEKDGFFKGWAQKLNHAIGDLKPIN